MIDQSGLFLRIGLAVALWLSCLCQCKVEAQQVWEFSPYRVQVWVAADWSVDLSDQSRDRLLPAINDGLEAAFKSAWSVETLAAPQHLEAAFSRGLDAFTLESISQTEFELVVAKEEEETSDVRSFDGALERLAAIAITHGDLQTLTRTASAFMSRYPELEKLLAKCTSTLATTDEIAQAFASKQIMAAMLPRIKIKPLEASTRVIPTMLPWQTQHLFREVDKVFFVSIAKIDDQYEVAARELDCPMRFLGPVMRHRTHSQVLLPSCARQAIVAAFAPVTRVEDTTLRSAQLTLRAGGLIVGDDNPASLHRGDILQPIIRRDDRNGIPSILEPLPWTFVAVTNISGILLDANVYSGISGALQGRRNRRTQRVALKVRPIGDATDVKFVVRQNTSAPQIGCEVYLRDLATEQLSLLGRTDWRGIITIPASESSQAILPEKVRLARAAAKKAAETEDPKKQQQSPPKSAESPGPVEQNPEPPPPQSSPSIAESDSIPLRQPLLLLYVKSGETVLARLPMVPGLTPVEVAELPSDARRLEAEAFLRGFQNEVLHLIGMRSLLDARAKQRIKEGKPEEARQLLVELRNLPSYTEMADQLQSLQRKMLDESTGQIPFAAKPRIDRMFQTTSDMLQKYLQVDLGKEIDRRLEQSRNTNAPVSDAGKNGGTAPTKAPADPDGLIAN